MADGDSENQLVAENKHDPARLCIRPTYLTSTYLTIIDVVIFLIFHKYLLSSSQSGSALHGSFTPAVPS